MNRTMQVAALAVVAVLGGALVAGAQDGGRFGHGGSMGHGGPMGMGHGDRGFGAGMMFEGADTDGDGRITREEFDAAAQARFAAADSNSDGNLSVEEMAAAAEARREEMRQAHEAAMIAAMIDRRDTNDDGMLSFEEMTPGDSGGRFFGRFDRDEDGVVTEDEMREAGRGMRERWMERRHDRKHRD